MTDEIDAPIIVTRWLRDTLPQPWDAGPVVERASRAASRTRQQGRRGFLTVPHGRTWVTVAGVTALLAGSLVLAAVPTDRATVAGPAASATDATIPTSDPTSLPARRIDDQLLPGIALVTEQVEPGVVRVVNDGIRDLARPRPFYDYADFDFHLVAGLDGSVWLLGPDGSGRARRHAIEPLAGQADFFRLGKPATYDMDTGYGPETYADEMAVDPAGALWIGLWHIDDWDCPDCRDWPGPSWDQEDGNATVAMRSDGTVVAFSDTLGATMLSHRRGGSWSAVAAPFGGSYTDGARLWATDDGVVWLWLPHEGEVGQLARFDGTAWRPVDPPDRGTGVHDGPFEGVGLIDVGPDGTMWAQLMACDNGGCPSASTVLARFDGAAWTRYDGADGVPTLRGQELPGQLRVAPNGSVWVNPIPSGDQPDAACGGLHNFDGLTWKRYLDGVCVYDMDVAPDGTVWVRGGTFDLSVRPFGSVTGPVELFAIRPHEVPGTD